MLRSIKQRFLVSLPASFLVGALWGSAVAVLEALLFNRWFHTGLQKPLATFELALNYVLYAGVGAVLLRLVVEAVRTTRCYRCAAAPGARFTEALLGAGLLILVLFNYLRVCPLGYPPLKSLTTLGLAAGFGIATLALVWALYRLRTAWRWVLRGALILWIAAGVLWVPLAGTYTGLLKHTGNKAPAGSYKNLLFLLIDTQRADFLDCYGADWSASPVADRLAAGGTLFEKQIAQSTWTLPSTASMMTGRFPSSHGAVAVSRPIFPTAPILAEALQQARYHTGAFVENLHVLPRNGFGRGFDRFWAYWLPWVFDTTFLWWYSSRLDLPRIELTEKKAYPVPITHPDQVNWDARTTTDRALDWLRELDDAPFFAYLHYMGPHGPYGPPEFLLDWEKPRVAIADHPRETGGGYPLGVCGEEVSVQTAADIRTMYAADILYVEHHIVRILDWLEETGKLDETLIVYTSDHGEEFYEHCGWNHGKSAFDEVLRVPLILAGPGVVPAGVRITENTRHIDLMPTILDLLGLPCPETVQGRSLRPLLEGDWIPPAPAYSEVYPSHPRGCSIFSLVRERHKVISVTLEGRSADMLFDLEVDPGETRDLAGADPERVDSRLGEMQVWDRIARQYSAESDTVPLDARTLQRLKSLGYID